LSLWSRDPLDAVLPWCEQHGVGFVPYAPLGRGFLTGRYRSAVWQQSDIRNRLPRFRSDAVAANLDIVERIAAVGRRLGATNAQVALAWALEQGSRVVPIPGTRRIATLEENSAAADFRLSEADLAALNSLPDAVGSRY
jgi:aryl-alcohol dehydrogenase-like predicted oxidoreductase